MFPPLSVNQPDRVHKLARRLEPEDIGDDNDDITGTSHLPTVASDPFEYGVPTLPPRDDRIKMEKLPIDPDLVASWFVVDSPREKKGIIGPFAVAELRNMYKAGTIKETTLVWSEGEKTWRQLFYQRRLRPKLLQMPIIPPPIGRWNKDLQVFDPIVDMPIGEQSALISKIDTDKFDVRMTCVRCGNFAVRHTPLVGEPVPDLTGMCQDIGSTKLSSEILPGFLWIGNAAASKIIPMNEIGITLSLNCTNMPSISNRQPFFHCKSIAMEDKPKKEYSPNKMDKLFKLFEKAFDYIEYERLYPERKVETYLPPKAYRGPTDSFGRPIKYRDEKPPMRQLKEGEKCFPPHVLIWSTLGSDRACTIAAAYIIKRFRVKLETALEIVSLSRAGMAISSAYKTALQLWSNKYTIGDILCVDCIESSGSKEKESALKLEDRGIYGPLLNFINTEIILTPDDAHHSTSVRIDAEAEQQRIQRLQQESLVGIQKQIQGLGDPLFYMPKIMMGRDAVSPWSGLLDLNIGGRMLGDVAMAELLRLLHENSLIHQLRALDLSTNKLHNDSIACLTNFMLPLEKDGLYDDETLSPMFELISLNLSDNLIEEEGAEALGAFLKQCRSIIHLNLSNNPLGDPGGIFIFASLARPDGEFFDAEAGGRGGYDDPVRDDASLSRNADEIPFNNSITDLNMSNTGMMRDATEALIDALKKNSTLTSLHIGNNRSIDPVDMKHLTNTIRGYSFSMKHLSIADTPLSLKSAGYLARIVDGTISTLSSFDFSRCCMEPIHIQPMVKYFASAKYLTKLDLSGNASMGDEGAAHLLAALTNPVDRFGRANPPLRYLDVNACGLSPRGCRDIITAVSIKQSIRHLDISSNNCGPDLAEYASDTLRQCQLQILNISDCKLQSKGAEAIFEVLLRPEVPQTLASSLTSLYLADNEIFDSSSSMVQKCLERNHFIEFIDLGFNKFTRDSRLQFQEASAVISTSLESKKTFDLTVNLIGNKCDPYELGTPARGRAKNTFRFGLLSNKHELANEGLGHIPHYVREQFKERQQFDSEYQIMRPRAAINKIN